MNFKDWKNEDVFTVIVGIEVILLFLIVIYIGYVGDNNKSTFVMGAVLNYEESHEEKPNENTSEINEEKYFRPSKLPIINDKKITWDFLDSYNNKKINDITIPLDMVKDPEELIINYFSILREASNYEKGKNAGCGTIGNVKIPYPIAYNFLSSSYKEKLRYKDYLDSFKNILHINLIRLKEVPANEKYPNDKAYFIEIETIKGSEEGIGNFAYYYGYVYIAKEGEGYRISHVDLYGEDYLCAPYHRWDYIGEAVVDIKYGNWCKLVKERGKTEEDDYVKKVYFKGTDGGDYYIEFYKLTNDYDIEVAQYKRDEKGQWQLIKLEPEKCLEKKDSKV